MVIFTIKGKAIEELPERQIEAQTREEAEAKYLRMFEEGLIESDQTDVVFFDEEEVSDDEGEEFDESDEDDFIDEEDSEFDEEVDDEDFEEDDDEDDGDEELSDPKIHATPHEHRPHEVWDHIDHTDYYLEQGYYVFEMGKEGSENEVNYLYKKKSVSNESHTFGAI